MNSKEAFEKWHDTETDYATYTKEHCRKAWNAALEWAAKGQEPVGRVLSEGEMCIGYDRRIGNVIWLNKPTNSGLLYLNPTLIPEG